MLCYVAHLKLINVVCQLDYFFLILKNKDEEKMIGYTEEEIKNSPGKGTESLRFRMRNNWYLGMEHFRP